MMRPFRFHGRDYRWRQDSAQWELSTEGQRVARVVPDQVHPAMYRIALGGTLSDMANLTRAKDAAVALADRAWTISCVQAAARPCVPAPTRHLNALPDRRASGVPCHDIPGGKS